MVPLFVALGTWFLGSFGISGVVWFGVVWVCRVCSLAAVYVFPFVLFFSCLVISLFYYFPFFIFYGCCWLVVCVFHVSLLFLLILILSVDFVLFVLGFLFRCLSLIISSSFPG